MSRPQPCPSPPCPSPPCPSLSGDDQAHRAEDLDHIDEALARLGCRRSGAVLALGGGHLHDVRLVATDRGPRVVKQLDPALASQPGWPERVRHGEWLADEFAARGVRAVAALGARHDPLIRIGDRLLLVYPYLATDRPPAGPDHRASDPDLAKVAGLLAQLHLHGLLIRLPEGHFDDQPALWAAGAGARWRERRDDLGAVAPGAAGLLERNLALLERWCERYARAERRPWSEGLAHCDLAPRNTVWVDDQPWAVDWELAGPCAVEVDLAVTASDWAATPSGRVRPDALASFIAHYRRAGGPARPDPLALDARGGQLLAWAAHNSAEIVRTGNEEPYLDRVAGALHRLAALEEQEELWRLALTS